MKRMFDKEEIVEIAKEGSVVDSELSETSENPVQNKVITEALGEVLPDTTGQTDKYLKVGSDGLEWADGGGKLYRHCMRFFNNTSTGDSQFIFFTFDSSKSEAYTLDTLNEELYNLGHTEGLKGVACTGVQISTSQEINGIIMSIYGTNESRGLYAYGRANNKSVINFRLSAHDMTDQVSQIS